MSPDANLLNVAGYTMTLRDVTPADMADVLALHQGVFGGPVDPAWFDWKFHQGAGEGVGLWHEGELVAHCGGVPRTLWHSGVRQQDLQIGDVMVAPKWRGILTRRGPFFHVSKRFYDSRLGPGQRFHAGFGFPSARHLKLAIKVGLLWRSGVMRELFWTTPSEALSMSRWQWRVEPLTPADDAFDGAIDRLWEQMRLESRGLLIGQRDAAYVRWRYTQRPAHSTVLLQLRRPWHRQPLGVAVVDRAAPGRTAQWLDWIGPLNLLPKACAMCRYALGQAGATGMLAWVSDAVLQRLTETGISRQSEVAQIGVPTVSSLKTETATQLEWWFMGGDTDFL